MAKSCWIFIGTLCLLLNSIQCQENTAAPQDGRSTHNYCSVQKCDINTIEFSIVLDTLAWAANWITSVGLYAGRQEGPLGRADSKPYEDLPNIYIPNELTANEIVRALMLTGKKQMVEENKEVTF